MAENIEYRIEVTPWAKFAFWLMPSCTDPARRTLPDFGSDRIAHSCVCSREEGNCDRQRKLKVLDAERTQAIRDADSVATGDQRSLPIDVFRSVPVLNMNANEVLATWQPVPESKGHRGYPNDTNVSQSSNDVFPTSVHAAVTEAQRIPALEVLKQSWSKSAGAWARR